MNELDIRYEAIVNNKALTLVKRSKLNIFFNSIRHLFLGNGNEYENDINHN